MRMIKEVLKKVDSDLIDYEETFKKRDVNKIKENVINIPLLISKEYLYKDISLYKDLINEDIYNTIEETYSILLRERKIKINNKQNNKNKYKNKNDNFNNINIVLVDKGNEFNEKEEKNLIDKMKLHYALKIKEVSKKIKIINLDSFICLIIGLILTGLYAFLSIYLKYAFAEMISIFGWVFIWEACDLFCFTNLFNRKDRKKYINLYSATYEFKELYEFDDIKNEYLKY